MALIGTISGSNKTTTSAVTGSLIIAANPGVITPVRPTDVVLYVSGSASSVGADRPSILFKGDSFVSGALGTDSYFQMKPVGTLRVPTNTTASYIYTSGSTNDIYFTQYNGSYTNTTRLRWLESTLGTGLLAGGALSSTSGSTTFNIASGSGLIVAYNAHTDAGGGGSVEPYPVIARVSWPNLNAQALPSLSTTQITYVGMDSTGTPYLKSTPFVDGDYDNYISLGRILHTDKVGTNGAVIQPTVSYGQTHFRGDFIRSFGPVKLSGHTFYASGSQGLKKDAGDSYAEGRNYSVDPDVPNYVKSTTDTAQNTSKIFYEYVNAAGDDVIANNGNLGYSVLDCNTYNNAGTLTTVGAGNKFTIQRVFWFPNAVNRAFYVYYGNTIYATIADAQAGIGTEIFTEGKNTRDAAIFLGYVIVKGVTLDFADPTTYKIIQAGSFRAVASAGAGASGTPGGANTHVQFNDSSVFNGTSDFRFEKSTGTALVTNLIVTGSAAGSLVSSGTLQVKDNSAKVVGSISTLGVISGSGDLQAGGNITGSHALLSGDLAVNGGDITTTAATFNLVTGSATTVNFAQSANTLSIGKSGGSTNIAGGLTGSFVIIGENLTIGGPSQADILTNKTTASLYNTVATTINIGGAANTISIAKAGASTNIQGNLTSSNLAVNGGNITTTAGTLNIASLTNVTNLFGSNVLVGSSGNMTVSGSSINLSAGTAGVFVQRDGANVGAFSGISGSSFTISPGPGVNIFNVANPATTLNLASGSGTTVQIGASTGRTTIFNDLVLGTGNIVVTNDATPINLISSGNITARLDTNNNGAGHRFDIQDWKGTSQFFVGEDGNAELSGSLVISGTNNMGVTVERMSHLQTVGGVINFDMTFNSIFYVNNPSSDVTANFTSLSAVGNNRIVTPTVILSQSATPRTITSVQIDGATQTIKWASGVTPTASANKQEAFGFSLIRSGSNWNVLGQMSTYG